MPHFCAQTRSDDTHEVNIGNLENTRELTQNCTVIYSDIAAKPRVYVEIKLKKQNNPINE